MKKLIFGSLGEAALIDIPPPECQPDTLLLRTVVSGLSNGTERNQMMGMNYNAAKTFPFQQAGYQTVSEVVEIGSNISTYAPGDLVVTATFGTHCEYHLAKETDLIVPLPTGLEPENAALSVIAAVALRNLQRASVEESDKLMICGAGPIGLFALQWATDMGCDTVVLTRSQRSAERASELGASDIGFGDEEKQKTFIAKHRPCSVAIETSGSPAVIDSLVGINWGEGLFKPGSRPRLVVLAGNDRVSYSCNAAQASEISIVHSVHCSKADLQTSVEAIKTGSLKMDPIIQDIVPASDIIPLYRTLRDKPNQLFGTVINWR